MKILEEQDKFYLLFNFENLEKEKEIKFEFDCCNIETNIIKII